MSTSGPLAANRTLFKNLGYDPEKDLTPISLFAILPNIIVINGKLPPKTLTEFIAYAKAHPKELNYGSVGVGSSQHLAAAYFEQITGVQLTHVPYRNIAQYTPDFLAGQVPLGFQLLPNVLGLLKNGDARALAVTSDKRMTALPDVPTAAEAGVKNYRPPPGSRCWRRPARRGDCRQDLQAMFERGEEPAGARPLHATGRRAGVAWTRRTGKVHQVGNRQVGRYHPRGRHHADVTTAPAKPALNAHDERGSVRSSTAEMTIDRHFIDGDECLIRAR